MAHSSGDWEGPDQNADQNVCPARFALFPGWLLCRLREGML